MPPRNVFSGSWMVVVCTAVAAAVTCRSAEADDCCEPPSWIFNRSTFTHAPETGARVAQYMRRAPVEELPDPRLVTSGYRRTRTNIRGNDGSIDSYYQVQSWGNGRGGLDAEWERFHDAWRQSYLSGGYYSGGYGYPPYGGGHAPGYGPAFPGGVFAPGYGAPGHGYGYQPPWHPGAAPYQAPHAPPPHGGPGPPHSQHHAPHGGKTPEAEAPDTE